MWGGLNDQSLITKVEAFDGLTVRFTTRTPSTIFVIAPHLSGVALTLKVGRTSGNDASSFGPLDRGRLENCQMGRARNRKREQPRSRPGESSTRYHSRPNTKAHPN